MATGMQSQTDPRSAVIRILEGATATNSPPSSYAAAGVDVGTILDGLYGPKGWPTSCDVAIYTTAGSGTMTATVKLWCGHPNLGASGVYLAAGTGSASTAGVMNGGIACDEHAADNINRVDMVMNPGAYRKWYAEITAIGGTATAVNVDLIFAGVPL